MIKSIRNKSLKSEYSATSQSKPPLDLSFREIFESYGIYFARQRKTQVKPFLEAEASEHEPPEWIESNQSDIDLFTYENLCDNKCFRRMVTDVVKLNNNKLVNIEGLPRSLYWHLSFDPVNLKSLDLSFNHLYTLNGIEDFENLVSLYLHSNFIRDVRDIYRLQKLDKLKTLTLHGNPVENEIKNYRPMIITLLPGLNRLDFSLVTKTDKRNSAVLSEFSKGRITLTKEKD